MSVCVCLIIFPYLSLHFIAFDELLQVLSEAAVAWKGVGKRSQVETPMVIDVPVDFIVDVKGLGPVAMHVWKVILTFD